MRTLGSLLTSMDAPNATAAAPAPAPAPVPPVRTDFDEVVVLAQDLRNLLEVVELPAARERADRIVQHLMSPHTLSWRMRQPIDINLAIVDLSDVLERLLSRRIRLTLDLAVNCDHVLADRVEIERILLNLVVSARSAMPEGGTLTIHTSLVRQVPPGLKPPNVRTRTYVRLAVTDSGPGMSSGARFRVLRPSPLRKEHGTELAMAVVAHTSQALGGTLRIEGDDGQGSRVSLDLPCLETLEPG